MTVDTDRSAGLPVTSVQTVQTVLGPVGAEALGRTLMHEHVWIDRYEVTGDYNKRLTDAPLVIEELRRLREAGWRTLCDVTPPGIGRDPLMLQRISRESGIAIVMGAGWYLEEFHPADVARSSVSKLAAQLVEEIEHGVGDTGVRPGIIGEIASGLTMTPAEERTLRAAARAHLRTGLPLTTHAFASRVALHQLGVLREEGADLGRVVIGHLDSVHDPDLHERIAAEGAWVQFDLLRGENEWEISRRVELIREVFARGRQDRLLLSQDICMKSHLRAYGGRGYSAIGDVFLPRLRAAGIGAEELEAVLVDNPRRVFTGEL